jgi:surface antigen
MKTGRIPALLLAAALPAAAANIGGDIPAAHFTEKDATIFREALDGALADGADGATVAWSNPKTGAGGEIKPLGRFERDGKPCRTVNVANQAKGRKSSGEYTLCKSGEKWLVTKPEAKKK